MENITKYCEYCPMKDRQEIVIAVDDIGYCNELPEKFCDIAKSNYEMFKKGEITNLEDYLNKQLEDYDNECERMDEAYEKSITQRKKERAKLDRIHKQIADKYDMQLEDMLSRIRECKAKLLNSENAKVFCEVFKSNQDLICLSGAENDIIDNENEVKEQLQQYRKQYKELLNKKQEEINQEIRK